MKRIRLFLLLASFWTLSGCGPSGQSYPTPIPPELLPTVIAQTAAALESTALASTPSATLPLTEALPTTTPTFTPTLTDTPTPIPPALKARIQIEAPGPMSLLASPLQLRMYVVAGETGMVQVALYGEDGRLLNRVLQRVYIPPPAFGYVSMKMPFEVRAAELARLEISVTDKFGRIESLASIHVTLLPVGMSQVNPPPPPFERAAIYNPAPKAGVFGGTLVVDGAFWPLNNNPVMLELQDEEGRVIATRQLSLTGDTYIPFTTTLPYKVSAPTRARLVLRQADERFNAIAYLYSLLVVLNP